MDFMKRLKETTIVKDSPRLHISIIPAIYAKGRTISKRHLHRFDALHRFTFIGNNLLFFLIARKMDVK